MGAPLSTGGIANGQERPKRPAKRDSVQMPLYMPLVTDTSKENTSTKAASGRRRRRGSLITPGTFVQKQQGKFSDKYRGIELLGKGSFGRVVLCADRDMETFDGVCERREVAVKLMSKKNLKNRNETELLMKEVNLLKQLDHPNIMKVFEFYEDETHFYLVCECYRGGELFDEIVSRKRYKEEEAKVIIRQILSGVAYIHQKNIVHRDLKPENILLERKNDTSALRIIDFGLSTYFHKEVTITDRTGTAYYIAPEVLRGNYDEKCDMWSIGVILYILLSGCPPFHGADEQEILRRVQNGRYTFRLPQFDDATVDCKNFIRNLLLYNADHRKSAKQALLSPWFTASLQRTNIKYWVPCIKDAIRNFELMVDTPKLTQAAMLYIASKLYPLKDIGDVKNFFSALDADGDGRLNKDELKGAYIRYLEAVNTTHDSDTLDKHVQGFMDVVDMDRNNFVDFSEFMTVAITREKLLSKPHVHKAFKWFDIEGAGAITQETLFKILSDCQGVNMQECIDMIREIDFDYRGEISFENFKASLV